MNSSGEKVVHANRGQSLNSILVLEFINDILRNTFYAHQE